MKRYTYALKLKDGMYSEYRTRLGQLWQDLSNFLRRNHIQNYSIWNVDRFIFGYCELPDAYELSAEDKLLRTEFIQKLDDTFTWISDPDSNMRLMYHDFGVVRTNKELIRHRVFMTHLKDGFEEEYKRRHDALVEKRGDHITQGPDSNFSIWSAGGYIFGYNEIDTTMEHEETAEEHEATIQWETKQLEIMDWITNDVDWLTGIYHPNVKRIAWLS